MAKGEREGEGRKQGKHPEHSKAPRLKKGPVNLECISGREMRVRCRWRSAVLDLQYS